MALGTPIVPYSVVTRMYLLAAGVAQNGQWQTDEQVAFITVNGNSLLVEISGRPPANGSIVDSSDIVVNFPDVTTVSGKLLPPNTIAWSNGTAWHKG